jgi:hypothetical protein
MHGEVLEWLRTNTGHSFNVEAEYNYQPSKQFPNGSVLATLYLD